METKRKQDQQYSYQIKQTLKQRLYTCGGKTKHTFLQRKHTNGQHGKSLNIANYQRNPNENYNEISPHTNHNGHHQKNLQLINAREGAEKWECKLAQPPWKFLKTLKQTYHMVQRKTWFKRILHHNVPYKAVYNNQARKQPKGPSIDEWIRKMQCIHTMEYYSTIKKNEITDGPEDDHTT